MNRIVAFCPVWKRQHILEVWWAGIQRLQRYWPEKFEIIPWCIVSTREDKEWCDARGIANVWAENKPLGRKHNEGLQALRGYEFDYIWQISSDNLVPNEALHYYLPAIEARHSTIGVDRNVMVDCRQGSPKGHDRRAVKFVIRNGLNKLLGGGRMISHEVIRAAAYELWEDDLNRGLDFSSQSRIKCFDQAEPYRIQAEEPLLVGLKSEVQVTPWERVHKGRPSVDVREIYRYLGGEEVELIKAL